MASNIVVEDKGIGEVAIAKVDFFPCFLRRFLFKEVTTSSLSPLYFSGCLRRQTEQLTASFIAKGNKSTVHAIHHRFQIKATGLFAYFFSNPTWPSTNHSILRFRVSVDSIRSTGVWRLTYLFVLVHRSGIFFADVGPPRPPRFPVHQGHQRKRPVVVLDGIFSNPFVVNCRWWCHPRCLAKWGIEVRLGFGESGAYLSPVPQGLPLLAKRS